jgi:thiosulfate sulfurtransferase
MIFRPIQAEGQMTYRTISIEEAQQLLTGDNVTVLDIRDPVSFSDGHIENALNAEAIDMDKFLAQQDKNKPLLIYCYHGISSQSAATFLAEKGLTQVYSLEGGYTAWQESENQE